MTKPLIYDIPTRLFHWIFALSVAGALGIAKLLDDDSPAYAYHMILGLILALAVLLRILWGFVGSRYARFSSFSLHPKDLLRYLREMFTRQPQRSVGHNPASSWAAVLMMGLVLGLASTGYLMASDIQKELFEEVHELFANTLMIVIFTHLGGILFHTLKHKDAIGLSMVHGRKDIAGEHGIEKSHGGVGLIFIGLLLGFAVTLSQNYDSTTQTLQFFGNSLQLGESENHFEENDDD